MHNAHLQDSMASATRTGWPVASCPTGRHLLDRACRYGGSLAAVPLGAYGAVALGAATIDPDTLDRDRAGLAVRAALLAGALTAGIWIRIGALPFPAWTHHSGGER